MFVVFDEDNRGVSKVDQTTVKGVEVKPAVFTRGKGITNVRLVTEALVEKVREGEKNIKIGMVDVNVVKKKEKIELKIQKKRKEE